jgi:very-short-patch-repair endonuclease
MGFMGGSARGFLRVSSNHYFESIRLCHNPAAMSDVSQLQIVGTSTNGSLWPGSLADRFAKSLAIHSPEAARPRSLEALTRSIAENAQKANERLLDQSFLTVAARALHIQAATTGVQAIISHCSAVCESPVELALAFAVGFVGRQQGGAVLYDFGEVVVGDAEGDRTLRIRPQARIAEFRIDLLLTMQAISEGPDGLSVVTKQLALEADGAEFHDRTQEQACRDRKRDRQLQSQGLSVFRFAGGEVWRDVFACAREAVGFLRVSVEKHESRSYIRSW